MYKSCNLIQHGLCFYNNKLVSCCFSPLDQINGQGPLLIKNNYWGEIIPVDELFERMYKYADIFKQGGCPKACENCFKIEEKDWTDEKYIDQITITHYSMCNADCVYCSNNMEKYERTPNTYSVVPFLKYLKEQRVLRKGCEIHMGGGEFSIYRECNELLELFAVNDFARVFVATSCIKYLPLLYKAMDEATTYMIVSLDSGCRQTYKRIKRVDAFNTVVNNLKKYASTEKSSEAIRLKYIIIPSFNDNINEFKKFLAIAKEIGIRNIIIDIDARYSRCHNYKIDDYFVNLSYKMNDIALKQGFITEFYCFFQQNTYEKNIKKDNFISQIIKKVKFKFFDKELKKLYTNHHYNPIIKK